MTAKLISEDSGNLIIDAEVSGQATYIKKYQRPERPGGESGITIAIGYDCGYSTAAQIRKDWGGRIPADMVDVLATRAAGLRGAAAQARLAEVRAKVVVPWDAAISEFYDVEVPRWLAKVHAALPNTELLSPDCLGALVSLAYNRGPSFSNSGDRFIEMRAIKAHMAAKEFAKIPVEFRKMERLWPQADMRGLITRREAEAKLFERGLAAVAPVALVSQDAADDAATDMATADPADNRYANVVATDDAGKAVGAGDAPPPAGLQIPDQALLFVQKSLKDMNYSPGNPEGFWGGMTSGALSGFLNDRGAGIAAPTSEEMYTDERDQIDAEVARAVAEGFKRPVTAARASGDIKTVAQVAPEVTPVRRNFLLTVWGTVATFATAAFNSVSDYLGQAWDFYTGHKDSIPTDPGTLSKVWQHVQHVPTPIWIAAGGTVLAFIAFNSYSGMKKITTSVQTGARQ